MIEPVDTDPQAGPAELLRRAQQDYAATQVAARAKQAQGGPGEREGIIPGGGTR
ncbi:hypothetical protein ACFC01_18010 [Streptomyces mirabilis]|uniref:hypothetical protein n=1 Tax=Streptomyces mirabilis TaxID=68239 RepID=UPI0035DD1FB9